MSSKHKLEYKWMGPYKVWYANPEHSTYRLMEIDGTVLKGTFPGRRLKRFERRGGYLFPDSEEEGEGEGERGVEEDLSSNDDRNELGDLVGGVEVTEGMEVEGEVPARPVIQLPGMTSQQRQEYSRVEPLKDKETFGLKAKGVSRPVIRRSTRRNN